MDPVTTSILAALTTNFPDRATPPDTYETLKKALNQKFGSGSDLVDALQKLEQKPDSSARLDLLKEEMGVSKAAQDPTLLALAQQLLQEIETESKLASTQSPMRVLPMQRPGRPDRLTGRNEELAQLLHHLQPGQVVAVCAPPGSGKSALASVAVWRLAPAQEPPAAFPDGLIYHNFYGQPRVDIALEKIVRAFQAEPSPNPYEAAEHILAERQALLFLENVEHADDLPGLLASRGNCGVLVTTTQPHESFNVSLELAGLPQETAVELLQRWSQTPVAERPGLRRLCELVGNLPLALQLIGRSLVQDKVTVSTYLTWLETTPLAQLEPAQRQQESVPLILGQLLSRLSETERDTLAVAATLAFIPFSEDVIAKTLTIETHQGLLAALRRVFKQEQPAKQPDTSRALRKLAGYGLIESIAPSYRIRHEMIHAYAYQQLTPPSRAVRRLATYYIALAWEWEHSRLEPKQQQMMDFNRPHFMKILTECLEWGDWEALHGLAAAVEDYLDVCGYWAERVIANEAGLIAAWQLGRTSEGAWLSNLGDAYRTMGHARWAIEHFEKSLATARQMNDWHGEGNSLGNLGLAYRDLGQIAQARQYFKESLAIFEEINSPRAELVRTWLYELDHPHP